MNLVAQARLGGSTSQQVFSALMHGLAEPGTIRTLPSGLDSRIAPSAWPILAIADVDIAVNANGDLDDPVALLIADATGARIVPIDQAWAVVLTTATADTTRRLATGDALHPELGARVAIGVRRIDPVAHDRVPGHDDSDEIVMRLGGPGIADSRSVAIVGLDPGVAACIGRSSGTFPAGFDTWLVDDAGSLVGIPRTTEVTVVTGRGTNDAARRTQ